MKKIPDDIEKIFTEVKNLIDGKIVNAHMAQPLSIENSNIKDIKDAKNILLKKHSSLGDPRIYIAQFWLALAFLMVRESQACYRNESIEHFIEPIMHAMLLTCLILMYEITIGQLPLQKTIDKLILPANELKQKKLTVAFFNARSEAARNGPLSHWRFFSSDHKLEQVFDQKKITVNMHESILLALSALKHQSFDCIAASALVLLKIIEKKLPYTLLWYYKRGHDFDGHNFIIAKDNENNAIIIDPWYQVCTPFDEAAKDDDFFLKYPLLSLQDKILLTTIKPEQFQNYQIYIDKLNETLQRTDKHIFHV